MIEVYVEGVQDEAEGDFCSDAVVGTIIPDYKKHRSSPHPGYAQSQPDTN